MSRCELAEAVGLDAASMNRIERGQRGVSTGELVAMAQALGVDVDSILRAEQPPPDLGAGSVDDGVRETLAFFRGVIDDHFAAEALARL